MVNQGEGNVSADLIAELFEEIDVKLFCIVYCYLLQYYEMTDYILPEEFFYIGGGYVD
jgi:hypothetical protein